MTCEGSAVDFWWLPRFGAGFKAANAVIACGSGCNNERACVQLVSALRMAREYGRLSQQGLENLAEHVHTGEENADRTKAYAKEL